MKLWISLYIMIWLAFLEFFIYVLDFPAMVELHVVLGGAMLALSFSNSIKLKKTDAPARIRRIASATTGFVTFQALLGIALYLVVRMQFEIPFMEIIRFIHLAAALTIIAQAASTATSFDMWEEKEFMPSS